MKSLKKVLLGLLLIGVSVNLDLNAGKRGAPCANAPEYFKVPRTSQEQDVSAIRTEGVDETDNAEVQDEEMQQVEEVQPEDQDDLFFQPANELPGDLDEMIIPAPAVGDRDYKDALQAMVAAGQIRQFDEFANLVPHLSPKAQNGAIAGLVFVGSQVARSFLPVVTLAGEVQAQDFAVIALGSTTFVPVAYITFQGGEWVVKKLYKNPELLEAIRSKSQEAIAEVIKTANEIPVQARNVAKKVKRAAQERCVVQ